jgi:O-antigen/teichoic acid export membrane protein
VAIFVFVPCMVGIAVVAEPLIALLYGPRWTPAAPLLAILAVSATFWPLHVLNLAAIGAQGRSDLIFRLEVLKRVISIGLIVACSPGGPVAIAWAVLAASLAAVAINTWYSRKLLGYGLLAQLRDQTATLATTALAAASGWCLLHWMPSRAPAMVLAIAGAALVYLATAALSRNTALVEILELLRTLQSSGRASVPPPATGP